MPSLRRRAQRPPPRGSSQDGATSISISSTEMSHTASKTWVSQEVQEREHFVKLRELLRHFVPHSPFPPMTLQEWLAHRLAMQKETTAAMLKRIEERESRLDLKRTMIRPAFRNYVIEDFRGAVLSQLTMWSAGHGNPPNRPQAPWPEHEELKHEGDDRHRSSYGRFLPLPRKPGNETVNWKAREMLHPFSAMDSVGPALPVCPALDLILEDPNEFIKIFEGRGVKSEEAEEMHQQLMKFFVGGDLMQHLDP